VLIQLDDVAKARPEITKAVENMVAKGKWTVPGYTESTFIFTLYPSFIDADGFAFSFSQSSEYVSFRILNFLSELRLTFASFSLSTCFLTTEPQCYLNGSRRSRSVWVLVVEHMKSSCSNLSLVRRTGK